MDTYTQGLLRVLVELPEEAPEDTGSIDVRPNDPDIAHSENNILQWMSYLPEECIRTMIHMGWDMTT